MLTLFIDDLEAQPADKRPPQAYIQSLKNSLLLAEYKESGNTIRQQQLFDQVRNNDPNSFLINISTGDKYHHAWGQLYQRNHGVLSCLTVNKGYTPEYGLAGQHFTEQQIDKVVQKEQLSDFYTWKMVGQTATKSYNILNYGGHAQTLGNCAFLAMPNVLGASLARSGGKPISTPQEYKAAKQFQSEKISDRMVRLMIQDAQRAGTLSPVEVLALQEQVTNRKQVKSILKSEGPAVFNKPFPHIWGGLPIKALKKHKPDISQAMTGVPLEQAKDVTECCRMIVEEQMLLPSNKRDYLSALVEDISNHTTLTDNQKIEFMTQVLTIAKQDQGLIHSGFTEHALHYVDKLVTSKEFTPSKAKSMLNNTNLMQHILDGLQHSTVGSRATGVGFPLYLLNNLVAKTKNLNALQGKGKLFEAIDQALKTGDGHQKDQCLSLLERLSRKPKIAAYINHKTDLNRTLSHKCSDQTEASHFKAIDAVKLNLSHHQEPYWLAKFFG